MRLALLLPATTTAIIAGMFLASCQSASVNKPAVLERVDDESVARLKITIAAAMGKERIDFGAMDLATSSEIPVLPPRPGPFEGSSPAIPTYFDLVISSGQCLVIKRSTGEVFEAEGIRCKPIAD